MRPVEVAHPLVPSPFVERLVAGVATALGAAVHGPRMTRRRLGRQARDWGLEPDGDRVAWAHLDGLPWLGPDAPRRLGRPRAAWRESEVAHLEAAIALRPRLAAGAIVSFGETWFLEREPPNEGRLRDPQRFAAVGPEELLLEYRVFGKGTLAVPYLVSEGFRVAAFAQRPYREVVLQDEGRRAELPYPPGYFEELLHEHRRHSYPSTAPELAVARARRELSRIYRQQKAELRATLRPKTRLRELGRRLGV